MLSKTWAQLKQLRSQKVELTKETVSVVSRLGKMGQLHDYVSIGDNGKLVLQLREALEMRGAVHVLHDIPASSLDLNVVLERGSVDPIGTFINMDYKDVDSPPWPIKDSSVDLVTMNQGLHHLPQSQILPFLAQVRRILRPGGLLIVREHNARPYLEPKGEPGSSVPDLIPMLDIAHSVFNAVTGVPINEERTEIRAFRSVQQWREIIESAGLLDTMISEVQSDDPTIDEMLCFYKPPFVHYKPRDDLPKSSQIPEMAAPVLPAISNLLKSVPPAVLAMMRSVIEGFIEKLPGLAQGIVEMAKNFSSGGVTTVVQQVIEKSTADLKCWLERFKPYFDSTDTLGGDIPVDLVPPELFLIVPALNRKVSQGKASAMEMVAAALIQDIQRALVNETNGNALDKVDNAVKANPFPQTGAANRDEILKKMTELQVAVPRLLDARVLDDLELPEIARRALKSYWAAHQTAQELDDAIHAYTTNGEKDKPPTHTLMPLVDAFASYLDATAWAELSAALDEIIKHKVNPPSLIAVMNAASEPEKLRGKSALTLWANALLALLSSPRVYLNRTMVFQARMLGLGAIYDAWHAAQRKRKATMAAAAGPLLDALQPLTQAPVNEVVMNEGHFLDVHNVAEVLSATYGYSSATASPSDVTAEIAKRLDNGTLHLAGLAPRELEKSRRVLIPMLDAARKVITLNTCTLRLKYRPILETDPAFTGRVEKLLSVLADVGIVKSLHRNDGHLTWFKLPEWMQVEMAQIFGQSMNHTPWYRFPFMQMIGLYFQVFLKEINVVRQEHGLAKALLSNAFLTDLIPGVVMFVLFGQMQLLALPVKAVGGAEYGSPELMVEQIVLLIPGTKSKAIDWKRFDDRIVSVEQAVEGEGLYVLTVPTFKPLTDILLKVAQEFPAAQVLEISNQRVIQVKLLLPSTASTSEAEAALIAKVNAIGGVQVVFDYRFPVDGTPSLRPPLCLAVRASTFALVRLIQFCGQNRIEVQQIYDFFT